MQNTPTLSLSVGDPGVLLVGNFLSSTGKTPQVCEYLARRLEGAGWSVLRTSRRRNRVLRLADMIGTAWRQRRGFRIAYVEVFSGKSFLWAEGVCWALRRAGKPYVLVLHGGALPTFAAHHPTRVRKLLGSAARVVAPSRYLAEALHAYYPSIAVIPNAMDLQAYPFRLRASVSPRLIWLRSFHSIYCPEAAPAVLGRLLKEWPEAQLTMVGPDTGDGSLGRTREVVRRLGLTERVHFPGAIPKSEVPRWLESADIFLNTTSVDNMPVSVIEAMACGLCVVSTNAGGIPYVVEHDVEGLLCGVGDIEAMAGAVCQFLQSPAKAEQLSRQARSKAERFDWSAILPEWMQLLRDSVGEQA